jgi:tetratricopeptide (TPR) repeat protein
MNTQAAHTPRWLYPLTLVAACLVVYVPAMRAGFVWDDDLLVTANPLVLNPAGLRLIWAGTSTAPDYAPITYSAFWMEWRLWTNHPAGYHCVNILLHAASVLLIWRVLLRLAIPGAWLAALLFAIHPVNVASVAWIAELKNTLSLFFYLLSILWYLKFEDTKRESYYIPALLAAGCAFLSKGSTVILPVVLLGCVWWRSKKLERKDLLSLMPFFVVAAWAAFVTVRYQGHLAQPATAHASLAFRIVRAGDAFWFYLWKDLVPVHLCAVYPMWSIAPRSMLSWLPALLAVACLIVFWFKRNDWGRAPFFAFAYFAIALLPVLGFVNMGFMDQSYVADWWQHLAIIAVAASAAAGVTILSAKSSRRARYTIRVATYCVVLFLAARTWDEASGYESLEVHCRRTLAINPLAWSALDNLGSVLQREGKTEEAMALYETAARIKPNDSKAQLNLGLALQTSGRLDEAMIHYQLAWQLNPRDPLVLNNLGMAFQSEGLNDKAAAVYNQALAINPYNPEAHNNLGLDLQTEGKLDDAVAQYNEALRIKPDFADAHYNLALALQLEGKLDDAVAQYQEVLRSLPGDPSTHNNLGNIFFTQGRLDDAIAEYQTALRASPNDPGAQHNLARALRRKELGAANLQTPQ